MTQHLSASPLDASEPTEDSRGDARAVPPISQQLAPRRTTELLETDKASLLTPFTQEEMEARGSPGAPPRSLW